MHKLKERLISYKKNYLTVFSRYFLYGFGFIETLLLPKLLDKGLYENYEYYKNAIFMFPNLLLGAYGGYIFVKYTKGYDMYDTLFSVGMFITLVFSLLLALVLKSPLLIIPLLIINLFVIIEQGLKVKKKYVEAFLFKPLLSIVILSIGFINFYWFKVKVSPDQLIAFVFLVAFIAWFPFVRNCILHVRKIASVNKRSFLKFYYIVKEFASGSLGSLVFLFVIFLERYFVKQFYPEFLAEYSFVFNISQIMVVILTVFNYITSIEYGESINLLSKSKVMNTLGKSFLLFIGFFIIYMLAVVGISGFYQNFPNMVWMILILASSKGFLFFIGIFKPIAEYKGYNFKLFLALSLVFVLNIIISTALGFAQVPILYLLLINAVLLVGYALYLLHILFYQIEYKTI